MITSELAFLSKVGWAERDDYKNARKAILAMRRKRLEKDAPLCFCGTPMRLTKEMWSFYCPHCLAHDDWLVEIVDGKPTITGKRL